MSGIWPIRTWLLQGHYYLSLLLIEIVPQGAFLFLPLTSSTQLPAWKIPEYQASSEITPLALHISAVRPLFLPCPIPLSSWPPALSGLISHYYLRFSMLYVCCLRFSSSTSILFGFLCCLQVYYQNTTHLLTCRIVIFVHSWLLLLERILFITCSFNSLRI